jgi:GH15 family glucan-1,4-alpha-glucosidase
VESDALLQQGPFADWADSVARQGRVLYTNVIYWKALREMSAAAQEVGFLDERLAYEATAEKVRKSIQHFFWRPDLGYFVTNQVFDNLSSGGNLLAIAWGLADDAQAGLILEKMQAMHMDRLENRLGGLAAYHTQAAWVWLGAWHVIALLRQGQTKQAQALFERLAAAVARDGEVLEVYGSNGHPLSSLWYLSESPLTWSAGMLFYAYSQLYPDQASSVLQQARSDGPENQVLADGARAG